jgi:hypothetical protein
MTRRDFRLIEEILKELKRILPEQTWKKVIEFFASELKKRYPRFDVKKFKHFVAS